MGASPLCAAEMFLLDFDSAACTIPQEREPHNAALPIIFTTSPTTSTLFASNIDPAAATATALVLVLEDSSPLLLAAVSRAFPDINYDFICGQSAFTVPTNSYYCIPPPTPTNIATWSATAPNASNTSTTIKPQSNDISSGAAIGIGIGCAVAGAAIALAIALLCFGWRTRRQRKEPEYKGLSNESLGQKITAPTTFAISENSAAAIVESNLPQPLQDATIKNAFSKIGENIEGHVLGFYNNNQRVNHQVVAQAILEAAGSSFPLSLLQATTLLENTTTWPVILRAVLGRIVSKGMDTQTPVGNSFLPPFASTGIASMAMAKGKRPIGQESATPSSRTFMTFLSKWRTISAFLVQGGFDQANWTENDPRRKAVGSAVEVANAILHPYATDPKDEGRLANLELIMERAARFAFTLFSQPSAWSFEWQDRPGELAVFPALLMQADEDGAAILPPKVFVEGKWSRQSLGT